MPQSNLEKIQRNIDMINNNPFNANGLLIGEDVWHLVFLEILLDQEKRLLALEAKQQEQTGDGK